MMYTLTQYCIIITIPLLPKQPINHTFFLLQWKDDDKPSTGFGDHIWEHLLMMVISNHIHFTWNFMLMGSKWRMETRWHQVKSNHVIVVFISSDETQVKWWIKYAFEHYRYLWDRKNETTGLAPNPKFMRMNTKSPKFFLMLKLSYTKSDVKPTF
jgi:hypothetical protein